MKSTAGIRRRIQTGFAFFCAIQFFLLVAIAIFSYHYGEDQSLVRVVESGATIHEYTSIEDAPVSLSRKLAALGAGTYELSGNSGASPAGLELHAHITHDALTGSSYRVLQLREETRLWPLIKNYTLFACMAVLLLLAFGGWTARTVAQRISLPLESLADRLRKSDAASEEIDFTDNRQSEEIRLVASALNDAFGKTRDAMDRESTFSRNVSHELRTPLTVIHTALDQAAENQQAISAAAISRARQACDEMELLTGACLALARNPLADKPGETTNIGDCIKQVIRESLHLLDGKRITLDISVPPHPLQLPVQQPLVRLVAGNMIRNAFIHCVDGEISITLDATGIVVTNAASCATDFDNDVTAGTSTPAGVGLSILDQACQRLGWRFELDKRTDTPNCTSGNPMSPSITMVLATIHFAGI